MVKTHQVDGPEDTVHTIPLEGGVVHTAHMQGIRPTQEDCARVATGIDIAPEEAPKFLEAAHALSVSLTKDDQVGGATSSAALVTEDHVVHYSHVGDSPIIVWVQNPENGDLTAIKLTKDHNIDNEAERDRLKNSPNPEERGEIMMCSDGLERLASPLAPVALTRGLGNTSAPGMITAPDTGSFDLKPLLARGLRVWVEVCCDGLDDATVQDYMDRQKEVAAMAAQGASYEQQMTALEKPLVHGTDELTERVNYAQEALQKDPHCNLADIMTIFASCGRSTDNCSSLMAEVTKDLKENVLLYVADGNGGIKTAQAAAGAFEYSAQAGRAIITQMEAQARAEAAPAPETQQLFKTAVMEAVAPVSAIPPTVDMPALSPAKQDQPAIKASPIRILT